jgi:hypothetical protein
MPSVEEAVQVEVGELVTELETAQKRLQRLHDRLPVSPREEAMLLGEAEPDVATEVRSIIECVIPDRIEPAIEALREAAEYRPKGKA